MTVILFEDQWVSHLYPITVGRVAYRITCGSYALIDWMEALNVPLRAVIRPHLVEVQRGASPERFDPLPPGRRLYLNARAAPTRDLFETAKRLYAEGAPGIVRTADGVVAAWLEDSPQEDPLPKWTDWLAKMDDLETVSLPALDVEIPLLGYAHDAVRVNVAAFSQNMEYRLQTGEYQEAADGVFLAPGAELGPHCATDTTDGPIVLETGAKVGPFCYLAGPIYIGPKARLNEHSALKHCVSLGHTTKVGGEVEASVIEPYSNKQHHGFIGHSYLGSWINLGAGTCNSDLKNTYGRVKMEYYGERIDTGMQFIGAIVGDYAKSAINTGIFTGKTIGVCSMLYGFVTTNVPSYVNYARSFSQVTELSVDVMIQTQRRMFDRRNVEQRPCDVQLLRDMYELTRHERGLGEEPLSL